MVKTLNAPAHPRSRRKRHASPAPEDVLGEDERGLLSPEDGGSGANEDQKGRVADVLRVCGNQVRRSLLCLLETIHLSFAEAAGLMHLQSGDAMLQHFIDTVAVPHATAALEAGRLVNADINFDEISVAVRHELQTCLPAYQDRL